MLSMSRTKWKNHSDVGEPEAEEPRGSCHGAAYR